MEKKANVDQDLIEKKLEGYGESSKIFFTDICNAKKFGLFLSSASKAIG